MGKLMENEFKFWSNKTSSRGFSGKTTKANHPSLFFNNITVSEISVQKHLGILLNTSLTFNNHIKEVKLKTNKTIGFLRKIQICYLDHPSLQCIKPLSEPIWITVMLPLIKLIMISSTKNLNP